MAAAAGAGTTPWPELRSWANVRPSADLRAVPSAERPDLHSPADDRRRVARRPDRRLRALHRDRCRPRSVRRSMGLWAVLRVSSRPRALRCCRRWRTCGKRRSPGSRGGRRGVCHAGRRHRRPDESADVGPLFPPGQASLRPAPPCRAAPFRPSCLITGVVPARDNSGTTAARQQQAARPSQQAAARRRRGTGAPEAGTGQAALRAVPVGRHIEGPRYPGPGLAHNGAGGRAFAAIWDLRPMGCRAAGHCPLTTRGEGQNTQRRIPSSGGL